MSESYGATLERFRDLVADQIAGYRTLLDTTRSATAALRGHDVDAFEDVLEEQVETLRRLKELERERTEIVRVVGGEHADERLSEMRQELRVLADEVQRAGRVERLVIERNGALVEARLGLHRQAGTLEGAKPSGVHQIA